MKRPLVASVPYLLAPRIPFPIIPLPLHPLEEHIASPLGRRITRLHHRIGLERALRRHDRFLSVWYRCSHAEGESVWERIS